MSSPAPLFFAIQDMGLSLHTHLVAVADSTLHDFHYFRSPPGTRPSLRLETLPRSQAPSDWTFVFSSPRSRWALPRNEQTRVEFFGETRVAYTPASGLARIYGDDPDHVYEAVYFVILSYFGEELDWRGTHRVHGLGIEMGGEGFLFLGASGTGKSSLALELLNNPSVRLLSDDTPLVSGGELRAFPQRIALRELPRMALPGLRVFKRFEYGEKRVLGAESFRDRITDCAPLRHVVFMTRTVESTSRLEKIPRIRLVWPLFKWLVVGYEVPQIWELFVRPSPLDCARKVRILFLRARTMARILLTANTLRLCMSMSSKETASAIADFGAEIANRIRRTPRQFKVTQRSSLIESQT